MASSLVERTDPRLRMKSEPVLLFGEWLAGVIVDLHSQIDLLQCFAITAPQIGIPYHIAVIDLDSVDGGTGRLVLINPVIEDAVAERSPYDEICASLPGEPVRILRSVGVTCTYNDSNGNTHKIIAHDTLAAAIQHCVDHLDGILTIDRCSCTVR